MCRSVKAVKWSQRSLNSEEAAVDHRLCLPLSKIAEHHDTWRWSVEIITTASVDVENLAVSTVKCWRSDRHLKQAGHGHEAKIMFMACGKESLRRGIDRHVPDTVGFRLARGESKRNIHRRAHDQPGRVRRTSLVENSSLAILGPMVRKRLGELWLDHERVRHGDAWLKFVFQPRRRKNS